MTTGYVLGERHRRDTPTSSSPTAAPATSSAPVASVSGPACPDPAERAAAVFGGSGLKQIFKIVTDNRTTVWICEDTRGELYYQSHTLLNGEDKPLQQNQNGLFLPGVTRTSSGFEVYDQKRNHFEISRQKLQIHFVSGKLQSNDVDTVED